MTAVIWIDWYPYHVARFEALAEHRELRENVIGIEMVGGQGVHGQTYRSEARAGLPIVTLCPAADWRGAGQRRLAIEIWRKLSEIKPAAVLAPGYYNAPALAAALWAKLHGSRSILMSESTREDHRRVWWKEAPKKLLVKLLFDRAVAGGKPHSRYLQELGFPSERIGRCYDVVDNTFYRMIAEEARRNGRPTHFAALGTYFLYVGRLAPEKNIDGLIRAYAAYREARGGAVLVIVGDGPERATLQRMARESRYAEGIHFEGMKKADEIAMYYAFANCFVLPSVREPWGLVVNEAMAAGLPVIVSRRCGCAEDLVIHNRNGYVFDPEDLDQLRDAMLSFDRNPEKTAIMATQSREIIGEYSPEVWASEVARSVRG
jgi:glycosyltransferase involved in cell wall biosynthesis